MKFKIFISLSLILIIFWACDKKQEKRELLTNRIEYDVMINNENTMDAWMNNVPIDERMELLEFLFGELLAGNAVDSMGVKIDESIVKQELVALDSNLQFGEVPLFEYVRNEYLVLQTIRFREKWTYNPKNFCVYKQVLSVAPVYALKDSSGVKIGMQPLFWVRCDTTEIKNHTLITNLIISDALVQNNTPPVIELYGKSPYYLHNFDENKRDKFFTDLKERATSHEIKSYDYFFNKMEVSAIEKYRDHIDSMHIPDSTGKLIAYEYEVKILPKEFTRLKFAEKWEFSKKPFVFKKTVMGINPSLYSENEFGEFEGYRPMFWVVADDKDLEFIRSVVN